MIETSGLLFDIGDERLMTIGMTVERLKEEFPDVSVSKLRYLEDQRLINPKRTKGGYRLFSPDDYRRLVTILTMQRDDYLPLKVIRKELERPTVAVSGSGRQGLRKADLLPSSDEREFTAEEILQMTGADAALLDELEDYELVQGRQVSGVKRYSETDAGIIGAAVQLAQAGLRPKNLRVLKSSIDRETGLIEQVLLPALRSRRAERRREAVDSLEEIVHAAQQLKQLLLAKSVRRLTGPQP